MAFALGLSLFICGISQLFSGACAQSGPSFAHQLCPPGWIQVKNRCFTLQNQALSFAQAQNKCKSFNSNLVSIRRELERGVVNALIVEAPDVNQAWIGLSINNTNSVWTDESDTTFANTQISNATVDGCVLTRATGWEVANCSRPLPYVCSRNVFDCFSICRLETNDTSPVGIAPIGIGGPGSPAFDITSLLV
ncbi:killer cell lectin-like receptor subfamily E member 1 [Corythoichthys intestinalis]|uniref:killer cell lectin-like receptor subfamily E member 1 n=1 Tax=Corythoichthys intestinalis TaxID=161448 RepID=UPI0025A5CD97|nr:killer cell lectin-like receptor subfamily E member 1 [Corythoichthys intestinalis]